MRLLLFLAACSPRFDVCDCPSETPGHAVQLGDACSCLPHLPMTPEPDEAVVVELSDGEAIDWPAVDALLADSDVVVRFDPSSEWDRTTIERTDEGPHRVVLDGGGGDARARVKGILTPHAGGPRHRVTIRGFEVTGSRDKGIFWEAGDDVLIEDVIIHHNRGTPALNLQYSNRSGSPSANFTVRNSHIHHQTGECLYIGGSEGEAEPSHTNLLIENNLIHDCHAWVDSKHDAINVKDRMTDVVVRRNVVAHADWGIEVASPGLYAENIVIDTVREGFQISDAFSPIRDMVFRDNAVLWPGHDGFHISTDQAMATGMRMERNTVVEAGQAGLLVASNAGLELVVDGFLVFDSPVAFDGWGEDVTIDVGACGGSGNKLAFDRLLADAGTCEAVASPDVEAPAGADSLFFTDDDPWLVPGGAQLGGVR